MSVPLYEESTLIFGDILTTIGKLPIKPHLLRFVGHWFAGFSVNTGVFTERALLHLFQPKLLGALPPLFDTSPALW